MFLFRFKTPNDQGWKSEDESDIPSISRLEDVFRDDYFYDT